MNQLTLAATHTPLRPNVSPAFRNLDVRKRGFDPFFSGIAVGAMATLVGIALGLCLWAI